MLTATLDVHGRDRPGDYSRTEEEEHTRDCEWSQRGQPVHEGRLGCRERPEQSERSRCGLATQEGAVVSLLEHRWQVMETPERWQGLQTLRRIQTQLWSWWPERLQQLWQQQRQRWQRRKRCLVLSGLQRSTISGRHHCRLLFPQPIAWLIQLPLQGYIRHCSLVRPVYQCRQCNQHQLNQVFHSNQTVRNCILASQSCSR